MERSKVKIQNSKAQLKGQKLGNFLILTCVFDFCLLNFDFS